MGTMVQSLSFKCFGFGWIKRWIGGAHTCQKEFHFRVGDTPNNRLALLWFEKNWETSLLHLRNVWNSETSNPENHPEASNPEYKSEGNDAKNLACMRFDNRSWLKPFKTYELHDRLEPEIKQNPVREKLQAWEALRKTWAQKWSKCVAVSTKRQTRVQKRAFNQLCSSHSVHHVWPTVSQHV